MRVIGVVRRSDELGVSNRRTVRRVLNTMTELGLLDHESGSPKWVRSDDLNEKVVELVVAIEEREDELQRLKSLVG